MNGWYTREKQGPGAWQGARPHGVSAAFRKTPYTGTIPCIICGEPAVGLGYDCQYYCAFHMRQKYGFLIPIGSV